MTRLHLLAGLLCLTDVALGMRLSDARMNSKTAVKRTLRSLGAVVLKGAFPLRLIRQHHFSRHFTARHRDIDTTHDESPTNRLF